MYMILMYYNILLNIAVIKLSKTDVANVALNCECIEHFYYTGVQLFLCELRKNIRRLKPTN